LRWGPPLGALGAAIGEIAIGTVATSTSTTTIILTGITTRTSTVVKLARATGGNTTRNTAEMRPMAIEEPRTSSVAMRGSSRAAELVVVVAPEELVAPAGLEPAAQVVREALVALAVQVVLAARADQEALAELAVPVVQEAPAGLVAQVVLAVLVVPAAAKLEHARVEAGLELVPAAEPAVNPVEAQVLVQVAAPARIKSAIAAHPHGQVRVPKLV